MKRFRFVIVTSFVVLAGCQGTDAGLATTNGITETTSVALTVTSSFADDSAGEPTGLVSLPDDSGIVYHLTEAQLVVRDIELYLPVGTRCSDIADQLDGAARCESNDDLSSRGGGTDDGQHDDDDDKIVIDGPFVVDLVAATTTPDVSQVVVPALDYRRLDIRVDDALSGGELDRRSLLVRADFTHMDVDAELVLALRFNEDIRIFASSSVALSPQLLVEFDAAQWLSGLSFGDCLDDGDLAIEDLMLVVDEEEDGGCSDVEDVVRDNLERSGRLLPGAI